MVVCKLSVSMRVTYFRLTKLSNILLYTLSKPQRLDSNKLRYIAENTYSYMYVSMSNFLEQKIQ